MFNLRLTTAALALTLALSAAALAVAPLASAKGGPGVRVQGLCTRGSTANLKLSREDGRLEVEFQVDQNRNGVPWKVTLRRNGSLVASTTATTHAPSGSFSLRRVISGARGTITAVATRSAGERCTAHAGICAAFSPGRAVGKQPTVRRSRPHHGGSSDSLRLIFRFLEVSVIRDTFVKRARRSLVSRETCARPTRCPDSPAGRKAMDGTHQLRVLIANQRSDRLELLNTVVSGLGHEVIAREIHVAEVAQVTARERPDVALVGLGESSEHALELITEIVRGAFCPVIALMEAFDGPWIDQAAQRGVYAYIVDSRPEELQSAIDITLRRFGEFQNLQGAFERQNAESRRERVALQHRQRQVLELHDGVIQGLSVAHLALELDRREESREALLVALENARAIVSRAIEELEREGIPLEQLIRDAAPA